MTWYYTVKGVQHGPVEAEELAKLIEAGAVTGNDRAFGPDMNSWITTAEAAKRLGVSAVVPPPLPSPVASGGMGKAVSMIAVLAVLIAAGWWWFGKASREVEQLVRASLVDPGSAQFRNLIIGKTSACGEVNSKNRMGGYTGFQKFYVSQGKVVFLSDSPETKGLEESTFNMVCTMAKVDR